MKRQNLVNIKRFSDVAFAIFLLFLLSPIIILSFLISIFETKAFPLFIQKRGLSLDGKLFNIYKIRTVKKDLLAKSNAGRRFLMSPGYKEKVPKLCKIVRKNGIDELPQLVNIIKGEMSLIGPRPLDLFDLTILKENYPIANNERSKFNSKPGILGMWQLLGKRTLGAENLFYWDNYYKDNFSLLLDIKIIVHAISLFFKKELKEDSILGNESVKQNNLIELNIP